MMDWENQISMKRILTAIIFTFIFLACEQDVKPKIAKFPDTFELDPISKDTINRTNEKGRQGLWLIFDKGPQSALAYTKCSCDSDTKVLPKNMTTHILLEKGSYSDNKKQGEWIYYHPDGSIERTLKYKDDVPVSDSTTSK